MTRYGTPYFVSRAAAERYYGDCEPHGTAAEVVARKLKAREIYIGPPKTEPHQRLAIIDNGTRYAIEEG